MCVVGALPDRLDSFLEKDAGGAVFLLDPLSEDLTILAVSEEFSRQTGTAVGDLVLQSFEKLQEHLPTYAVSRSARTKVREYCRACGALGLEQNAEVSAVQTCRRSDGSAFVAFHLFSMYQDVGRPRVLGVQLACGEGLNMALSPARLVELHEDARSRLAKVRAVLDLSAGGPRDVVEDEDEIGFRFYRERLQEQCLLFCESRSVARREPEVLPRGAQVFSDKPVRKDSVGLRFAIRVDEASEAFSGLPLLGFTRKAPVDSHELYPAVSSNQAQSVLVGGSGEASARDAATHFSSGFRAPPQSEVETFCLEPDVPRHLRRAPALPTQGDILECRYTWQGQLQLLLNGEMLLDFNVRRPLDEGADYYATLDVSFALHRATLVPPAELAAAQDLQAKGSISEECVASISLASLSFAAASTMCGDDESTASEDPASDDQLSLTAQPSSSSLPPSGDALGSTSSSFSWSTKRRTGMATASTALLVTAIAMILAKGPRGTRAV